MKDRLVVVGGLLIAALWVVGAVVAGEPALTVPATTTTVTTPTPDTTSPSTTTTTVALSPAVRSTVQIQVTDTLPPPSTTTSLPPIVHGLAGTTDGSRCTQWEPLLALLAPPGGWDVQRMSRLMRRESGCCPAVRGGDRTTDSCTHLRVVTYSHRSDVGLLQINGVNYNPARCGNSCVVQSDLWSLMDPETNIRAAATLCQWWRDAGSSCYRPWS